MGHMESWEVRWKEFQEVSGGKLGTCNDSVGRPVCRRQIRKHFFFLKLVGEGPKLDK